MPTNLLLHIGLNDEASRNYLEFRGFKFGPTVFAEPAITNEIDSGKYRGVVMDTVRIDGSDKSKETYEAKANRALSVIEHARAKRLPLLLITGADRSIRGLALGFGADIVCAKPCSPETYCSAAVELFGDPTRIENL